jgi:hypothetical protein
MTEEKSQGQSCLFQRGDYRISCDNPKSVLHLNPGEDDFCSSETTHNRRMVPVIYYSKCPISCACCNKERSKNFKKIY